MNEKQGRRRARPLRLRFLGSPTLESQLESKLHCQLQLSGISHALTEKAVKVKQPRRAERVDVVLVVEGIEHLDDGNQRIALAKFEGSLDSPIKREVLIVLAQRVAIRCGAYVRRYGLSRTCLHAEVSFQAPTHVYKRIEVELMPNVAVRESIVKTQIVDIQGSIREWIALVRVVVPVFREHIVRLKLITLVHALPDSGGKTVIERFTNRAGDKHVAQRGKQSGARKVKEASQVNALRMSKIEIHGPVSGNLLLEAGIQRVDS